VRFAHISDTHIKNLKYHYEYKVIFEQLYDTLREKEVDYIIHCGDIAHTKTQISPEFVEMCSDFFRNLAEIAPTYIILGNHDGNLKNSSRQDALTPIAEALNLPDLHMLKDSGETHIDDKFCLNVLSVFDRDNWIKPVDTSKINIALYHGSISNCKTDMNWTMTNGEDSLSIFDDFDFAMLGDIHRRQFLDEHGRVWYAGSTVQQNHGETNDKGILIWDIEDKDEWEIDPIVFENPKPFITIELTQKGRMPKNISIPTGARLRLVSNNNLPLDTMKRAVDIAKHRFVPESISFLNRAAGQRGSVEALTEGLKVDNLRDIGIQEELIDEYLVGYEIQHETLEKVYDLNKKYNKLVENDEDISRNVNWKLKNFEFDNLFNYGEKNNVNFGELGGIVGIFGKNFSGKSSIVDGVLWTLFNSTSKNERKNLNVINQNQGYARGKVEIQIGERVFTVERRADKYIKRLKGEETLEAKTDLNFEVYDMVSDEIISLNGLTRMQTDANIRKQFGSIEDFSVSSLSSQHGALSFIDEGSTRRKEIIAKFLDLELFEKKFKLAKEDSVDLKGALKRLEEKNYDDDLVTATENLSDVRSNMRAKKRTCDKLKSNLASLEMDCIETEAKIDSIPAEIIDISKINKNIRTQENQITSLNLKIFEDEETLKTKQGLYKKIVDFLDGFELDEFELASQRIADKRRFLKTNEAELNKLLDKHNEIIKKEKLLEDHEYDPNCNYCCENEFVKEAHSAVALKSAVESDQRIALEMISLISQEINELNPEEVETQLSKYYKVEKNKHAVSSAIADLNLEVERNKNMIHVTTTELAELVAKRNEYEENKEAIENLESLIAQLNKFNVEIKQTKNKINSCEQSVLEFVKLVGSYEQKIEGVNEQKQEYRDLQREYAAYDLYMRAMHPNGIAYDIIKKKIPVINQEIAKVLANVVDFEVFFEATGNKFDIFIKHPRYDERPIEMASGAEKSLAAIAIRLALLGVSSLPTSDIFILDEPGTALDEDNMSGFIQILELIKVYFKNVLLISHLDSLKDCVDMQIVIEKKDGYARVNQ
tara:strand:+ start:1544 stop:4702 length:3159 start_codon:yes stop_codon:yes gene_type:complete